MRTRTRTSTRTKVEHEHEHEDQYGGRVQRGVVEQSSIMRGGGGERKVRKSPGEAMTAQMGYDDDGGWEREDFVSKFLVFIGSFFISGVSFGWMLPCPPQIRSRHWYIETPFWSRWPHY